MKRKLFTILVIVLLLSLAITMLAGCDKIFSKNEARDANQVVAKIVYNNQVATITKAQLASSFNAYAYSYVQYYSMTYEQAASYILSSLAQRELLVLYVKDRIASEEGLGEPANLELRQFLSNLEYVDAVDKVNKDMQTSLESIIKELIEEDKANQGAQEATDSGVYTHEKITKDNKDNVIRVFFDSDGGTDVETQKILKGEAADRPTNPTKDGYTFIGWYVVNDNVVSGTLYPFGADAKLEANLYLKAKWTKYLAPRTEKAKEEEEDTSYDYSKYTSEAEIKAAVSDAEAAAKLKFFDAAYAQTAKDKAQETLELTDEDINKYFDKSMKQLKDKLADSYMDYDYYLNGEFKTLILAKYQRMVGYNVEVSASEVIAEYDRLVANNIEVYANSDSAYETAITGTLSDAIWQNYAADTTTIPESQDCYGFVINILLKLDSDEVAELTKMASDGTYSKEQLIARRNELLNAHMVAVSNPDYSSEAECDHYTEELDNYVAYDAQTDKNHQCTCLDPDHKYDEYNKDNDFNKMIEFKKNDDGKWEIVYNVHECPTMAYLSDPDDEGNIKYWPAMSDGTRTGIVEQIYNSFKQIDDAVAANELSHIESVYWYRELATAWLYLVGDDSGGTSSDSNNGGLGYMVSAKDSDVASSYISAFTDRARTLINNGVGSYSTDGTLDNSYLFADSFIENGSTSGYAGIFILMTTYSCYDATTYTFETEGGVKCNEGEIALDMTAQANKLPVNYVTTYDKELDNCKTIYDVIYDKLLSGKKYEKYSLEVNKFGEGAISDNITYYEKNYESLWKNLDKSK